MLLQKNCKYITDRIIEQREDKQQVFPQTHVNPGSAACWRKHHISNTTQGNRQVGHKHTDWTEHTTAYISLERVYNHLCSSSTVPVWVLSDLSKETVVHSARSSSSSSSSSSSFTHITQQPLSSVLKAQYSKERAAFRHRWENITVMVMCHVWRLHHHRFAFTQLHSYILQCWLHFKVSAYLILCVYLKVSIL